MVATDDRFGLRFICRILPSWPKISPTLHMDGYFQIVSWFLGLPWEEMISRLSLLQDRADTCMSVYQDHITYYVVIIIITVLQRTVTRLYIVQCKEDQRMIVLDSDNQ